MHILLGYGYYPGTTGIYFERCLRQNHDVTFVGTPWAARPGFSPTVDVAQLADSLPTPPDLFLYIDSGNAFYAPTGLEKLRCPTAAYLIDAMPPFVTTQRNTFRLRLAQLFDYVFVAHVGAVDLFREWRAGEPVGWLPLACDLEIHGDQHLERVFDVGFVGQDNPIAYPERSRVLKLLGARYRMNDRDRPVYLKDMARVYSQSKIGFNMSVNDILTMRFFEVMAAGALLITEASARNGQNQLPGLVEGRHFITFANSDDLLQKIDYYLSHPTERVAIAAAGCQVVLREHTYAARASHILNHIAENGRRQTAPLRRWPRDRQAHAYMETHSLMRMVDATVSVPVEGRGVTLKRARQLYLAATALLRRIKHEWK